MLSSTTRLLKGNIRVSELRFYTDPAHHPFQVGNGPKGALLIHGFAGTPGELRGLADHLVSSGFTAEAILLPGFGPDIINLPRVNRTHWLATAEESWTRIRHNHRPTILVGHSMGSSLAMHLAATRPPDLLVLVAPFWRFHTFLGSLLPVAKYLIRNVGPIGNINFQNRQVRHELQRMLPDADLDDPQVLEMLRRRLRLPVASLEELRQVGAAAYRLAPRIKGHVLIIQGRSDLAVAVEDTRRLLRRFCGPITYHEIEADHRVIRGESPDFPLLAEIIMTTIQRELGPKYQGG
ncbi:MAG: alpha/beta fold hydrolase [Chloroflexi bacterium]|nr:alpha/beta fold hydrolase [Chloroflexota bacterium]